MSKAERDQAGAETRAVMGDLEHLMDELRACVDSLQAILTEPEVPGDQSATA